MTDLHQLAAGHVAGFAATGGLLIGLSFGWTVYRSNFCVMGALSDLYNLGDRRRLHAWGLAIAIAALATQTMRATGLVPLERAMYVAPNLNWLGQAIGGLIFGFGMVLAGGCPARNLVRFGAGDLRSLIVLLTTAIVGLATLSGLLAPLRDALEQATAIDLKNFGLASQDLGAVIAHFFGGTAASLNLAVAVVGSGAALASVATRRGVWGPASHVYSGLIIGALVAAAWFVTGLAYDEFAAAPIAPQSLTFIKPLGDTLDWVQRFTAAPWPGLAISSVVGTVFGAHAAARRAGRVRMLGFADSADLKTSLAGAALMGAGGIMGLGCTIGQGIAGLSTLAIGSMITTAAFVFGGWQGLRYLERTTDV